MIISVNINGTHHNVEKGSTITQALDTMTNQKRDATDNLKFADFVIALNHTFIPRSQYPYTQLHDNDALELLSPMAGG
jgi:thiamine biosynthesis protein ThiS